MTLVASYITKWLTLQQLQYTNWKKQSTYIAPCIVQTTLKQSGTDHTVLNLQRTPCLPLPRKRSPDGASTECGVKHLIAVHYSFIDPEEMKGWVGLVGWPIVDSLPTSATGQAQDGERTLTRDWRSTAEPLGPTMLIVPKLPHFNIAEAKQTLFPVLSINETFVLLYLSVYNPAFDCHKPITNTRMYIVLWRTKCYLFTSLSIVNAAAFSWCRFASNSALSARLVSSVLFSCKSCTCLL